MQSLEPWSWVAGIGSFFVSFVALLLAAYTAWPTFVAQRAERRKRQSPQMVNIAPPWSTTPTYVPAFPPGDQTPTRWTRTRNRLRGWVWGIEDWMEERTLFQWLTLAAGFVFGVVGLGVLFPGLLFWLIPDS